MESLITILISVLAIVFALGVLQLFLDNFFNILAFLIVIIVLIFLFATFPKTIITIIVISIIISLANYFEKSKNSKISENDLQIIDHMDGLEFEHYTKNLLQKLGYVKIRVLKSTGDFGVDVIAHKDGLSYGFQCKRWEAKISVSAIQEIATGVTFHNLDIPVVITNSTFTPAAINLAQKTNVTLYDREHLKKMIIQASKA